MSAVASPPSELSTRPADRVRQRVVSADFHVCSCESAVRWLDQAAEQSRIERAARYVCVANVTDVMDARKDPNYSTAIQGSALTVPDGKPVVWALRSMGHPIRDNVRGSDLMQQALENESIANRRHVMIAGTPEAREGLRHRFPKVNWVGDLDFRFDDLDEDSYGRLAEVYQEMNPDYAWVSLGGGKQVRFMHRFTSFAGQGVLLGVGAAFDFHAGLIPEAPLWMRQRGFEWLYRLSSEPRRLWHRYLVHNPPFLYHWGRELIFGKAPEPVISGEMGAATVADSATGQTVPRPYLMDRGTMATRVRPANRRVDTPRYPTSDSEPRRPVSIVVPMFNEEECVEGLLDALSRVDKLLSASCELEFVLVDDGSSDNTALLLTEAIADYPGYRLVRHEKNRGVAAAIHTGITAARHPTVASIDADGSYDLSILQGMIPMTSAKTPMVTASPYHPLGGIEGAAPWRVAISRAASTCYLMVMPAKLDCYTACFRTYHRETALQCAPKNDGFTGIAEVAWRMLRRGEDVAEYPAILRARTAGASKMRIVKTTAAHARLMSRVALATLRDRLIGRPKTDSQVLQSMPTETT